MICSDCSKPFDECPCPHDWDISKSYWYQDLGYQIWRNTPCNRCGDHKKESVPDRRTGPAVRGPYHPWDGVSSCGQVRHQRVLASIAADKRAAEVAARQEQIRSAFKDGAYYWALWALSGPETQPRIPFVVRFLAESVMFFPVSGDVHVEPEPPGFVFDALEIVCPCPVPDEVRAVVDADVVLGS